MSQENVEIVRRAFEAWSAGDVAAAFAAIDADVVARRLAPMPDPGTWHGHQGLLDVVADWMRTFEEFKMTGEEFIDAGDHVVVRVAQQARGAGSGVPVTATFWFVHWVRDGKMVTFDMYAARSQAFEAASLSE
jgi:ketosteroid isomerase-like protein